MHNLALALHRKGYHVTGSDDEIFEPARTRLLAAGLLPQAEGWFPERITPDLDAVVVGMHARADNPELLRAQALGLRIYSYPEYLYEQSRNKTRIVIGGSHGKTTTTAMILHVLAQCHVEADYMVGAQLEGFDIMVRLSDTARVMVIEGDEYLTSPLDPRPKFHLYKPHVAIVTGIEWDHVNVFPTFEIYKEQFAQFVRLIEPGGTLIYCADDREVCDVVSHCTRADIALQPYDVPPFLVKDGITRLLTGTAEVPLRVFGRHNLLNLHAALLACRAVGVTDDEFYHAIASFAGASKRLELVKSTAQSALYRDFAHAPSKVRATVEAMREQYPERLLVACLELHTFSSLSSGFISQYQGTMDNADQALVYFNRHALQIKHLPPLDREAVRTAFGNPKVCVFDDSAAMVEKLKACAGSHTNFLMMSSGNFDGIDIKVLADELLQN